MKIVILFLLFATTCIGVPFPQSQECPEGWLQNLGHCYLFGSDGLGSWAEAKAYCKEKGGFLAEIPNEETNTYLVDNMKTDSQLQKKWWWIGANDIANEGQFAWDNSGASLEFDAWNNNNPDDWQEVGGEDCAALYCNNKNDCHWNDLPCSGKYTIFEQWNLPAGGEGYPLCEIDTTQAGIKQLFGCTHGSNCVVGLLSYHNKYVVAENTGEANADRDRLGPYEKFSVTFDTKNKVQFKGYLGKYLVAEIDGTVNANQDQAVTGATWTVESGSNGNIGLAFKSTYGKYLVAENTGELNANRDAAGPYETFTVVDGNCYEDEIVPQEGKSCKHIEAWKNICDGSKTDCLLKGKEKCTFDPNCHGIMYHPGYWSKDNKGVLACTKKTLRDQPAKDWSVFLKVPCDEVETRNEEDQLKGQWNQHLDKVGSLEIAL